jgi:hypothetical protein
MMGTQPFTRQKTSEKLSQDFWRPSNHADTVKEYIEGRSDHWKNITNTTFAEKTTPATWAKRQSAVEMKTNVPEAKTFAVPRPWNSETATTPMLPLPASHRRAHPLRASDSFERAYETKMALTSSMPEILSVNRLDANAKANASARSGLRVLS